MIVDQNEFEHLFGKRKEEMRIWEGVPRRRRGIAEGIIRSSAYRKPIFVCLYNVLMIIRHIGML